MKRIDEDFLHAAAAPDLNHQRETDRRFGAGQAVAPVVGIHRMRSVQGDCGEVWEIPPWIPGKHNIMFSAFGLGFIVEMALVILG